MKKTLLFFFATVLLMSCGPVRIVSDSRTDDGDRVIVTSDKHLFGNFDIALGAKLDSKDTVLTVLITYDGRSDHGVFDVDDQMMIRLTDQSVITLKNIYHKEFEKETTTDYTNERVTNFGYAYTYDPYTAGIYVLPYEASSFIPKAVTRVRTLSYALYLISKTQLEDIINKGVIKLRIELETEELDMPAGYENIPGILAEQYTCLKERFDYDRNRSTF